MRVDLIVLRGLRPFRLQDMARAFRERHMETSLKRLRASPALIFLKVPWLVGRVVASRSIQCENVPSWSGQWTR